MEDNNLDPSEELSTLQKAIKQFLESRELDNCSPKTLKTYEQRLRYFSSWLLTTHNIDTVENLKL